ncbi:hypothetical protein DFJ73DRAFT_846322 [Zopfochytrium polystomum]|nr:hypothetical protein DFJ73DRAFT_846322 [Zopfochytrium polystomum]
MWNDVTFRELLFRSASAVGNSELVRHLLVLGGLSVDDVGFAIKAPSKKGYYSCVLCLLENGAPQEEFLCAALDQAVRNSFAEIVVLLFRGRTVTVSPESADVRRLYLDFDAFEHAVQSGDLDMVKKLRRGAVPTDSSRSNYSAIASRSPDMLELILDTVHGQLPDMKRPGLMMTAIISGANTLRVLLKRAAAIEVENSEEVQALRRASYDSVRFLLYRGADAMAQGGMAMLALRNVQGGGEFVDELIQLGLVSPSFAE